MVLTPKFRFEQTALTLVVHISLPNIRISGMELTVVGQQEFSFYCRPYLLRLHLPGMVYDEDEEDLKLRPCSQYLPDTFTLLVTLVKVNPNEEFQGLDFLTTLLLDHNNKGGGGTGRYGLGVEGGGTYGFLLNFSHFFGEEGFLGEFPDLIDLPNPDTSTPNERRILRLADENKSFDFDRYRVDLLHGQEDYLYEQAVAFEIPVFNSFTDQERDVLVQLSSTSIFSPKSDVDLNISRKRMLKVLDVLLAYCYEFRFSTGDFTVESHTLIRKLSATLSWLEEFDSVNEVCQSFTRRCLTFPYLRRWDLCCLAAMDCRHMLQNPSHCLKALLSVRLLFQKSQSAYLLNRLFVDDMCVYVQAHSSEWDVDGIRQSLQHTFGGERKVPSLALVGWNLSGSRRRISQPPHAVSRTNVESNNTNNKERNLFEELD